MAGQEAVAHQLLIVLPAFLCSQTFDVKAYVIVFGSILASGVTC